MFIYYVLINDNFNIYESEEELTPQLCESIFQDIDGEIEVYDNCSNGGPFGLVYKNF